MIFHNTLILLNIRERKSY